MKRTKEVLSELNITRQTLINWINSGLISAPNKDWRGWYEWSETNIKEIKNMMSSKNEVKKDKNLTNNQKLSIQNRRYLGSKKRMLDFIEEVVDTNTKNIEVVADIFGGTGVVSDLFRNKGKKIIINDILKSNYISYITWFGEEEVDENKILNYIKYLNDIEGTFNYVSENFGDKYFSLENAMKIGAIREEISQIKDLNEREKAFLLTSLIYAMDKVANTVGHYDAFRKKMDMNRPITLIMPEIKHNKGNEIYCEDANNLVKRIHPTLTYIDTPYNSRQYGDAYHLLENIVNWEKPDLQGVAMKMKDRSNTKSDYSTNKAPKAFEELINNIHSKYILVSYNNMANKGNGRSNAKISNEEIVSTLRKKGKVKVFETDFQVFTTGKSKIEDHKELLYLCEISEDNGISKLEYKNSAVNYTGSKFKLLNQIIPHFPKEYDEFIDLFSGGGAVAINSNPQKTILINDSLKPLINLYRYFSLSDAETVLNQVEEMIEQYDLSNTKANGYSFYGADSSSGLAAYNKEKYQRLRANYNNGFFKGSPLENIALYLLTVYGFNNQIRFNRRGEFNLPVGKRDFNIRMEKKLIDFIKILNSKRIIFSNDDFRDVVPISNKSFIYADPPYSITTATYTENNGWNINDDIDLFNYLDKCNKNGIKFALSNVTCHNGRINEPLLKWSEKYRVINLDFNYNNSNYQSKAKNQKTQEVLITNY